MAPLPETWPWLCWGAVASPSLGGVTAHLLPELPANGFLAAFNAKAEQAGLVPCMPLQAVTDAEIGLRGAARVALQNRVSF